MPRSPLWPQRRAQTTRQPNLPGVAFYMFINEQFLSQIARPIEKVNLSLVYKLFLFFQTQYTQLDHSKHREASGKSIQIAQHRSVESWCTQSLDDVCPVHFFQPQLASSKRNHLKTCALFLPCGTYCCQSVWRWKRCTVGVVGTWSELPQKNSETAWCLPSTAAGRVWWCLWQRVHAATRREVGGGSWRCFGGTVQWPVSN